MRTARAAIGLLAVACTVSIVAGDPCTLPKAVGSCNENLLRWFYNPESGDCEYFMYSGCGGNANSFQTRKACELECDQEALQPAVTDCFGVGCPLGVECHHFCPWSERNCCHADCSQYNSDQGVHCRQDQCGGCIARCYENGTNIFLGDPNTILCPDAKYDSKSLWAD